MLWNILLSLLAFVLRCYFDPFEFCTHLELDTIIFTVVYFSTVITFWLLYGFIWRNKSLGMCCNRETIGLYWEVTVCYIEMTWCNLYYSMDFAYCSLKSPVTRLCVQQLDQSRNGEIMKAAVGFHLHKSLTQRVGNTKIASMPWRHHWVTNISLLPGDYRIRAVEIDRCWLFCEIMSYIHSSRRVTAYAIILLLR